MASNVIHVIVKWAGGQRTGNPILFFPQYDANAGRICCYAHIGQHSEADMSYYRGCRNPQGLKQIQAGDELLAEYARKLESYEALKRVYRDTARYRRERYARSSSLVRKESPMETQ